MDKNQIETILEIAGYSKVNNKIGPTPLVGITHFNENRFIDPQRVRYEFDFENNLMKVYIVKKSNSGYPAGTWKEGTYDYYDNELYRYLCDDNGDPICDYIDFESIDIIGIDDTI